LLAQLKAKRIKKEHKKNSRQKAKGGGKGFAFRVSLREDFLRLF